MESNNHNNQLIKSLETRERKSKARLISWVLIVLALSGAIIYLGLLSQQRALDITKKSEELKKAKVELENTVSDLKIKNDTILSLQKKIEYVYDELISKNIQLESLPILDSIIVKIDSISNSSKGEWFTVVASFAIDKKEEAIILSHKVDNVLSKLHIDVSSHVYKTRISNNYAVTIGEFLTKSDANKYTKIAKEEKIAVDAFPQINRNWIKIE